MAEDDMSLPSLTSLDDVNFCADGEDVRLDDSLLLGEDYGENIGETVRAFVLYRPYPASL